MAKNRLWTEEEEEFLRQNYGVLPTAELARKFQRDPRTVKHKAFRMGLKGGKRGRPQVTPPSYQTKPIRSWSPDEDAFLLSHAGLADEELGDLLKRPKTHIATRRKELRKRNLSVVEAESFKQSLRREAEWDNRRLADWKPYRRNRQDDFINYHSMRG